MYMSKFDHRELRNVNVFLNSKRYSYNDLQLDFKTNKFTVLYEMLNVGQRIFKENHPERREWS